MKLLPTLLIMAAITVACERLADEEGRLLPRSSSDAQALDASDMAPESRVRALELLAEYGALRSLGEAGGTAEAAAAARVEELHRLMPQLRNQKMDDSFLSELRSATAAALAATAPSRLAGRLAGMLTLANILWFIGCLLVVVALAALFGIYLAALVALIPLWCWEALGYATSAALLHRSLTRCSPSTAPFLALTALLLFTACAASTASWHFPKLFWDYERPISVYCMINFPLYALAAVRLQSSMLGTLSVWWAASALGFFIAAFPFLTIVGFTGGLSRPFGACLLMVLPFLPSKIAPERFPLPAALAPFQTGIWLWCPLVMNLASLIAAFEGGPLRPTDADMWLLAAVKFLISQLPEMAVIGATLAVGVLLDVEQCRAVGAVFTFLYVGTKLGELDWGRAGIAWATLAFGALLWAFAYSMHTWPHFFRLSSVPVGAPTAA